MIQDPDRAEFTPYCRMLKLWGLVPAAGTRETRAIYVMDFLRLSNESGLIGWLGTDARAEAAESYTFPPPHIEVFTSCIVHYTYNRHRSIDQEWRRLMIRSCRDKETRKLLNRVPSKQFGGIEKAARIKLALLDGAASLQDLTLPGLRLEKLKGNRKGQHSIRINDQYRICFEWKDDGADNVEITDYH